MTRIQMPALASEQRDKQALRFMKALIAKDDQHVGMFHTIELHLTQGNFELAYNAFREILPDGVFSDTPAKIVDGFNVCLGNIKSPFLIESLPGLREDISRYRQQLHVDGDAIRFLCIKLIHLKYNDRESIFSLQQIADDGFLLDCLANDYYPDPHIEVFLTDIRRQLLLATAKELRINSEYLVLYQVLALQGYLTDYVFYQREDEAQIVASLNELVADHLSSTSCSVDEIAPLLLVMSMYQPLIDTAAAVILHEVELDQLPDYLQSGFVLTLLEPLDIDSRVASIETLGSVIEESLTVPQQFEENPFPRGGRLSYPSHIIKYRQGSRHLQDAEFNFDALDSDPLEILVAGCGTGFQPLAMAKSYENVNITGIDINRKSLACAERLSLAYGVNNVHFYQADILELADIFRAQGRRFAVVECTGVLNHLQELDAGLANLVEVLEPGGVLNLGLYSTLARACIDGIRQLQQNIRVQPDPVSIREFRREFMISNSDESLQALLSSGDFYNLLGCRDLLFNTHESSMTIPEIEQLLSRHGLAFVGFHSLDPEVDRKYQEMFPTDSNRRNLSYWHQFEHRYPDSFQGMYLFHCRKTG